MNVSLTKHFEDFIAEQVKSGRYKSRDEVVRAALRQLEESERQHELQAFETAFRNIDRHSPAGEPTPEDFVQIDWIVKSIRAARRESQAA